MKQSMLNNFHFSPPEDVQSPLQNVSSVWPELTDGALQWPASCSAWQPRLEALPGNKNTDQGEATTNTTATTNKHQEHPQTSRHTAQGAERENRTANQHATFSKHQPHLHTTLMQRSHTHRSVGGKTKVETEILIGFVCVCLREQLMAITDMHPLWLHA